MFVLLRPEVAAHDSLFVLLRPGVAAHDSLFVLLRPEVAVHERKITKPNKTNKESFAATPGNSV